VLADEGTNVYSGYKQRQFCITVHEQSTSVTQSEPDGQKAHTFGASENEMQSGLIDSALLASPESLEPASTGIAPPSAADDAPPMAGVAAGSWVLGTPAPMGVPPVPPNPVISKAPAWPAVASWLPLVDSAARPPQPATSNKTTAECCARRIEYHHRPCTNFTQYGALGPPTPPVSERLPSA